MASETTTDALRKFLDNLHEVLPPVDMKPSQTYYLAMKRKEAKEVAKELQTHQKELESCQRALQWCKSKMKKNEAWRRRIQSNALLKLNKEQQSNVEKKGKRNMVLIKEKQEHLQELKEELDSVIMQQQQLEQLTEENCINAKFLTDVLKEQAKFQEPDELITHFNTRERICKELSTVSRQKELEKLLSRIQWDRMEYGFERLSKMTQVEAKRRELENVQNKVLKLEATWDRDKRSARRKTREQTELCLATCSMSRHMLDTGIGISKVVKTENVTEILDEIQEFINDLNLIWEKVTKPEPSESGTDISTDIGTDTDIDTDIDDDHDPT